MNTRGQGSKEFERIPKVKAGPRGDRPAASWTGEWSWRDLTSRWVKLSCSERWPENLVLTLWWGHRKLKQLKRIKIRQLMLLGKRKTGKEEQWVSPFYGYRDVNTLMAPNSQVRGGAGGDSRGYLQGKRTTKTSMFSAIFSRVKVRSHERVWIQFSGSQKPFLNEVD